MVAPQTETTSTTVLLESGWTITPLNVTVLQVTSPETVVNLSPETPEEIRGIGTFELVSPSARLALEPHLHQALLGKSLREYERIWRVLAER